MKHEKLQTIMAETKKKLAPYTEKVEYLQSELATAKADYEQAEPKHGRKAISIKFEISEIQKELVKAQEELKSRTEALANSLYAQLDTAKREILDEYVARVKEEKGEKRIAKIKNNGRILYKKMPKWYNDDEER